MASIKVYCDNSKKEISVKLNDKVCIMTLKVRNSIMDPDDATGVIDFEKKKSIKAKAKKDYDLVMAKVDNKWGPYIIYDNLSDDFVVIQHIATKQIFKINPGELMVHNLNGA